MSIIMISIIVPIYNSEKTLNDSESILCGIYNRAREYANWLVDNLSFKDFLDMMLFIHSQNSELYPFRWQISRYVHFTWNHFFNHNKR